MPPNQVGQELARAIRELLPYVIGVAFGITTISLIGSLIGLVLA